MRSSKWFVGCTIIMGFLSIGATPAPDAAPSSCGKYKVIGDPTIPGGWAYNHDGGPGDPPCTVGAGTCGFWNQ